MHSSPILTSVLTRWTISLCELKPDAAQCAAVEDLPPIHADPFDRLLIAQAKSTDMKLITHDHLIADYGDVALVV